MIDPVLSSTVTQREHGALRRTSTVDISIDPAGERLTLAGAARDVAFGDADDILVLDEVTTRCVVEVSTREVVELDVHPRVPNELAPLVGLTAGSGFRRAVREALPGHAERGSLLNLLLDEVPVATVIAGSLLRRRPTAEPRPPMSRPPLDVCAGWERGGLLATTTLATGNPPLSVGPVATRLDVGPEGRMWHRFPRLGPWSMRRARSIERRPSTAPAGGHSIEALFRDSRMTDDVERVVHEYAVHASIDEAGLITRVVASPRTLPAPECPLAAVSADRLVGTSVTSLREHVSRHFSGTSTCTHLNDTLRALGDLDRSLSVLDE